MAFSVGVKFTSYEDLEREVKKFEIENNVNLYKKESKKIEAVKKKLPKRVFRPELVYASIVFACVRNGKYRHRLTTGDRPKQSTFGSGCEFAIKLRSLDGQSLSVTQFVSEHNHVCNKDQFRHHPAQRRLDPQQAEKVRQMVQLNANKKLIQTHVEEETNKVVLLKDIHNVSRPTSSKSGGSELDDVRKFLSQNLPSVNMEVTHCDGEVRGLFFQDKEMREIFTKFPEVLMVDSTYKVNTRNMPLFTMAVIDGNMETHPVCFSCDK